MQALPRLVVLVLVLVVGACTATNIAAQGGAAGAQVSHRLKKASGFKTDSPVREIVLLPMADRCVVLLESKTAELWDIDFGARLASFQASGGVYAIACAPDGKVLWGQSGESREIQGDWKYPIARWEITTGKQLKELSVGPRQAGVPMRTLPNGTLVLATQPRPILVTTEGAIVDLQGELSETSVEIHDMDLSLDGRLMATAHYFGGCVVLWNTHYKQLLRKFEAGVPATSSTESEAKDRLQGVCSLSGKATRVLSTYGPGKPSILVWDAKTGDRVATLDLPGASGVPIARFAGDDEHVLSTGPKGSLLLWSIEKKTVEARAPECGSDVTDIRVAPDGSRAVVAYQDHTVAVWSLSHKQSDGKGDKKK